MSDFPNRGSGQSGNIRLMMLVCLLTGLSMSMAGGCSASRIASSSDHQVESREYSPPPLVLASRATLEVLGSGGLTSAEMDLFNSRKDFGLGADLPPAIAPVNVSQVYIRDQQWILNGRPWDNYMQTTRSLQMRSR
ncbi:MAG: hypothetical protein CMJ39_04065 [Phycisphaerae bacterium]|nr:hypothetical protein [Phycisphaerae bacterium]